MNTRAPERRRKGFLVAGETEIALEQAGVKQTVLSKRLTNAGEKTRLAYT